jgi:hypothetical protein
VQPVHAPQVHSVVIVPASNTVRTVSSVPTSRTGVSASGQLAFTGSDIQVPATVGVLALAAGLGLTVLGRRRESQEI